jgi:hypothetical protein
MRLLVNNNEEVPTKSKQARLVFLATQIHFNAQPAVSDDEYMRNLHKMNGRDIDIGRNLVFVVLQIKLNVNKHASQILPQERQVTVSNTACQTGIERDSCVELLNTAAK